MEKKKEEEEEKGRDFHENERELRDNISFFENIASFTNAKQDLPVVEESIIK